MPYVSINPGSAAPGEKSKREFSALIKVVSSRYDKLEYNPDSEIKPRIGIKWVMETTRGNTFDRTWSTGLEWDDKTVDSILSKDRKRISENIKKNSDAAYLLYQAIKSDFPSAKLTDDVSVFEGEAFFMDTDQNTNASGSSRKIYPKKYHPEGWEAAKQEVLKRIAERDAKYSSGEPATMTNSYTPPPVVLNPDTAKIAGGALTTIVTNAGGSINRTEILKAINGLEDAKTWTKGCRQEVTTLLWELPSLTLVASENGMKVSGETVSFN